MRRSRTPPPIFRATRSSAAAVACAALLAVAACATGPRPSGLARARETAAPRSPFVLTDTEVRQDGARSLRDVVSYRWPTMFWGEPPHGAGLTSAVRPTATGPDRFGVYDVWGGYVGGPEFLAEVRPAAVRQLRRLTAEQEYTLFGREHPAGAIVVTWADGAAP